MKAKFRASQWLDTSDLNAKSLPMKYGIQVNIGDGNGWLHYAEKNTVLVFKSQGECGKKIDALRKALPDGEVVSNGQMVAYSVALKRARPKQTASASNTR